MRHLTFWRLLSLLSFAFAMASCLAILGDDFEKGPATTAASSGSGGSDATGGGGAMGGNGSGGKASGPQLTSSLPAADENNASLRAIGQLYFDRSVNHADAVGKVSVRSDTLPNPGIADVAACPDAEDNCVQFIVPASHLDGARLAGGTTFTVVIDRTFPDLDANTNSEDTSFSYTTFAYADFIDDGSMLNKFGAIEYIGKLDKLAVNSLYLLGLGPENFSGPVVHRVPLDGEGLPGQPETVSKPNLVNNCTGSDYASHSLDYRDGLLVLGATRCQAAVVLGVESKTGGFWKTTYHDNTSLGSPNNRLGPVDSATVVAGQIYFGVGYYGGQASKVTGIIANRPLFQVEWAMWLEGVGLFDTEPDFYLTASKEGDDEYVFVASGSKILKIKQVDQSVVNTHTLATKLAHSPGLRTDSQGRLWLGDPERLIVYDTKGVSGFSEVAVRDGIDMSRFALREDGNDVHVYFALRGQKTQVQTLVVSF
jgi:hypothetical protein